VSGGSGFVCSLQLESAVLFKPATCGSPRTYDLSGKPDGTYTFTVRASGNGSGREPATQQYQLDSTAPPRPAVEATPVSPAADHMPAWRFSGENGSALDCRVSRGQATVVDWTSCTNPKPFDLAGAADGDYRVTVRARDAAGNVSQSQTSDYELDSTPPATPVVTSAPKADDIDRSPTWTFAGEGDARFTCTLTRGSEVVSAKSSCAGAKTFNLSGAQPGSYTFSVEATDAAGNKSQPRAARYVLAAAPATGPATGGGGGGGAGSGSGAGAGTGTGSGGPAGSGSDEGSGGPSAATGGSAQQPQGSGGSRR
jgi:predicted phage tail protein